MGELKSMTPKGGLPARQFLEKLLKDFGKDMSGVFVIALTKDGEIVSGWSKEVHDDIISYIGALEAIKMDFWDSVFQKRSDYLDQ